ncbi:MAG: hypothetical protein HYS81_04165 [Candidatus Aenigmatarchaeota archaeon]|nr:MAG: hypothetical protein HYS81_04165 [Candidatus Aenigmarchaeota archaeon]
MDAKTRTTFLSLSMFLGFLLLVLGATSYSTACTGGYACTPVLMLVVGLVLLYVSISLK